MQLQKKIANEPAFIWWAKDVLRKCNHTFAKVRSHYWKRTHRFGVLIPMSVNQALLLDDKTGTDLWQKTIKKEMKNVMPAFTFLEQDEKVPIGYQHIDCHMIFDVKLAFTQKAQVVAGEHMTEAQASLTYSSVVSHESIRIAFTVAALNNLDVLIADIGNSYLNADCREKVYTIAGPAFK